MKKNVLAAAIAALFVSAAFPVTAAELPDPLAVYTFEDAGALGKDMTGNGNSLAVKGEVTQTEGYHGKGARFHYKGALTASAGSDGFDFVDHIEENGTKQMTISYRVRYHMVDLPYEGWRRIVSNGCDSRIGYDGFTMLGLVDNVIVPGNVNPACVFNTEAAASWSGGNWSTYGWTEEWTHIAWTVDLSVNPGRCIFYVDGTAIFDLAEKDLTNAISAAGALFSIGADYYENDGADVFNHPWAGELDDFYVYDTILDADQVKALMNHTYTAPVEPDPEQPSQEVPPTSDPFVIAAACAGAALLPVVLFRRKARRSPSI